MVPGDENNLHDPMPSLLREIRDEIRGMRVEMREGFEHQRLLLATTLEGHEYARHGELSLEITELKRRLDKLEADTRSPR